MQPSSDFAATTLADAAVMDEMGTVRFGDLDARERQAWLASVAQRDAELDGARSLMLDAVVLNPGQAIHQTLVGVLTYLSERRADAGGAAARPEKWLVPLRQAMLLAPGYDPAWTFLAGALLETWEGLPEAERMGAPPVLSRAFLDTGFVGQNFLRAAWVLGLPKAASLLPSVPAAIASAQRQLAAAGGVQGAATLRSMWEKAEATARSDDLARLEERARLGDLDGLLSGCRAWISAHSPWEFDDPAARRQAARVMELWPPGAEGTWRGDRRRELVRYFLDDRSSSADPGAFYRMVDGLRGVPVVVQARAALRAGDTYAWDSILRTSGSVGSLEWTPFFVEKAWADLKRGRVDDAVEALRNVAAAARDEFDVLLPRRELARRRNDEKERERVDGLIEDARSEPVGPEAWSPTGALSLCVDPEADATGGLRVNLHADKPALVTWGWNGARDGTAFVDGERTLTAPFAGLQGRVTFAVRLLAGAQPTVEAAERTTGSSLSRQSAAATEAPRTAASVAGVAGSEKLNSARP